MYTSRFQRRRFASRVEFLEHSKTGSDDDDDDDASSPPETKSREHFLRDACQVKGFALSSRAYQRRSVRVMELAMRELRCRRQRCPERVCLVLVTHLPFSDSTAQIRFLPPKHFHLHSHVLRPFANLSTDTDARDFHFLYSSLRRKTGMDFFLFPSSIHKFFSQLENNFELLKLKLCAKIEIQWKGSLFIFYFFFNRLNEFDPNRRICGVAWFQETAAFGSAPKLISWRAQRAQLEVKSADVKSRWNPPRASTGYQLSLDAKRKRKTGARVRRKRGNTCCVLLSS